MDPYATLGVGHRTDVSEIKRAWRKLAFQYHPDRGDGLAPAEVDRRAVRFREAKEAWDLLRDPEQRALYDQEQIHQRREAQEAAWAREEAVRRRQEARATARYAWEAQSTLRVAEALQRREFYAWRRRVERTERAHQRIIEIERARRVLVGRRLLLTSGQVLTRGVIRVRAVFAAMLLEDL